LERLILASALMAVAVVVALVLQRRRPDAPTQPTSWPVPAQVDRHDFARPTAPWLVAVFTSATCDTCSSVEDKVALLDSDAVATQVIEAVADKDLHRRYGIDAVPTLVIADGHGIVQGSFVGPVTAADLWAKVAEVRATPSTPPDEGAGLGH
jgi:hypothetical protein